LDDIRRDIVRAIRQQVRKGKTHGQLAVELGLERRHVSRIVCGERGIGGGSFAAIMKAKPPWLWDILSGYTGRPRGGNGGGGQGPRR
jgi:hypothetical protein